MYTSSPDLRPTIVLKPICNEENRNANILQTKETATYICYDAILGNSDFEHYLRRNLSSSIHLEMQLRIFLRK